MMEKERSGTSAVSHGKVPNTATVAQNRKIWLKIRLMRKISCGHLARRPSSGEMLNDGCISSPRACGGF